MSLSAEELIKMMRAAIREERESLQSQQAVQPQEDKVSHVLNCPQCYPKLIKGLEDMKNTSEVFCDDCELPLGSGEFAKQIPSCPRCGSKHVHKGKR